MTTKLLKLPSLDGASYDMFAIIPPSMALADAVTLVNSVIAAVNAEDFHSEDGLCADGKPVQDNLWRRLEAHGFTFPKSGEGTFAVTANWDEHVPD